MLELDKSYTDHKSIFDELLVGSGVVVFKENFLKAFSDFFFILELSFFFSLLY